jgi:hypothetical protein
VEIASLTEIFDTKNAPDHLLIDNLAFSIDFLKARAEHMFSRADFLDRAPANAKAEFD